MQSKAKEVIIVNFSKGTPFPSVHIENKGVVSRVYVDGKELNGIKSIEFLHSKSVNS